MRAGAASWPRPGRSLSMVVLRILEIAFIEGSVWLSANAELRDDLMP